MERTIISWNFPNWITVVLMAAAGYAAAGVVVQILRRSNLVPAVSGIGSY